MAEQVCAVLLIYTYMFSHLYLYLYHLQLCLIWLCVCFFRLRKLFLSSPRSSSGNTPSFYTMCIYMCVYNCICFVWFTLCMYVFVFDFFCCCCFWEMFNDVHYDKYVIWAARRSRVRGRGQEREEIDSTKVSVLASRLPERLSKVSSFPFD